MRRGSTHGLRRDSARFRSGEGQSLRNPGQLHDRPSAGPTVRLLGSKIYEATIASSGAPVHEAIRTVTLIAAPQPRVSSLWRGATKAVGWKQPARGRLQSTRSVTSP